MADDKYTKKEMIIYGVSVVGYVGTKLLQMHCPQVNTIIREQGPDFFSASAYPTIIGLTDYYRNLKPSPKIAKVFNKCRKVIPSVVTFAALCGYEALEAIALPDRKFDIPDVIAYGLGLTVIRHGADIVDLFKQNKKTSNPDIKSNNPIPTPL